MKSDARNEQQISPSGMSRKAEGLGFDLASVFAAFASDVGDPTFAHERGVLSCAEIGERGNLGTSERVPSVSDVGELRVVGSNGVGEGNEVLFGHGIRSFQGGLEVSGKG